jgi:hypothetical protein
MNTLNKYFLLLSVGFLCINMQAQDNEIKDNIEKAKALDGKFFNKNGKLALAINLDKITYYYKWRETADTSSIRDRITSWDVATLREVFDVYVQSNDAMAAELTKEAILFKSHISLENNVAQK